MTGAQVRPSMVISPLMESYLAQLNAICLAEISILLRIIEETLNVSVYFASLPSHW